VIKYVKKRNIIFLFLTVMAALMMYTPLRDLFSSTVQRDYYSHILLIPLVSGYFMYLRRKQIFPDSGNSYGSGMTLVMVGILLYFYGMTLNPGLNQNDRSSLLIFSVLVFWVGGFILLHGTRKFRIATFPLLFLAFMIPIPSMVMDKIIYFLQVESTEVAYLLFGLTGVSVLREGFVMHLPGISIEVAEQCSGIRSSLALLITGIVAAQFFLQSSWKNLILIFSVIPLAVLKNGIRVVTLSLLGIYVDQRFLTEGFLHRSGGFVFFIPSLVLLGLILWLLKRTEKTGCRGSGLQ